MIAGLLAYILDLLVNASNDPSTDISTTKIDLLLLYVIIHDDLSVYFKSSVEEARYLLASTGGSGRRLSAVRGMRRRSLDMVIEEQQTDPIKGDNSVTSLTSQLKVPRHRNRSRSLDNSFETKNSFEAFKESLKVRLSDVIAI